MKNLFASTTQTGKAFFFLLLLCNALLGRAQTFQTAIGYGFPTGERSPGGLITNAGDYLVLGRNIDHPAFFFNPAGDMQLIRLDASGNVIQPAKMLGQDVGETATWIEKSTDCNGTAGYIIAGNQRNGANNDMLLTHTALNGTPQWVQRFGTQNDDETSVCVKQDGAGNFILVGTKTDASTGVSSVYAVKTDCSGKFQWSRTYTVNGSLTTASVTAFATMHTPCPGLPNVYYITGKVSTAAGNDEVFILSVSTANGSAVWMKTYDIAPGAHDVATCIQGSCTLDPQGNGDLWVSGYSTDAGSGNKQVLMMRTDFDGTLLWANNYEVQNSKQEFATHFQFTNKGDLVLTGKAEAYTLSDPPENGQCLLMKMDNNGGSVYFTRVFNMGYASQGNRVEQTGNDEFFITGHTYEIVQPHAFDYNILAIKTNQQGETKGDCYHSPATSILKRTPVENKVIPVVKAWQDFFASSLLTKLYDEKQTFCATQIDPCQNIAINANFSVSTNGLTGTFTDLSTVASGTIFSWDWDFGDGNTASFASATNPVHTYANPGTYLVCLVVTAGTAGMICRDTFCMDIKVEPRPNDCPDNLVLNGTFTDGLTAGNLGFAGNVNNWSTIFNSPQVVTHDSCADAGAIQMWGDQVVGEGIGQSMTFLAGVTYQVTFCGMWIPSVQDSVRIRFRASVNPLTNYFNCTSGVCDEIFLSPVLSTAWATYTSTTWTPTQNYNYLNVTIWNNYAINDGAYVSWARVDDICIRRVGIATATEEASTTFAAKVFPNPTTGDVTVEFQEELPSDGLLCVTDLMGRRLQQIPLNAGQVRQTISLGDYPAGVYLVQVLGSGSVLYTSKVVRQGE